MNLLLLDASEVGAGGEVTLTGRRAEHLLRVLGVEVGGTVRAGVLDVGFGRATVLSWTASSVLLRYEELSRLEARPPRALLLALPRPKVLSRCLQHAAALGFSHIALVRCQRSEKAHLNSGRLDPARTQEDCSLGLEQGGHVRAPRVELFTRFKPFVEDELSSVLPAAERFVANPGAPLLDELCAALPKGALSESYTLAIGPEGGFVPYEVELLRAHGFRDFAAPVGSLRVESAISYFAGQLDAAARLIGS